MAKKHKKKKYNACHPLTFKIINSLSKKYLDKNFNIKLHAKKIEDIKGPYIIIGNHISFWDPFIMCMPLKAPVHFVISDAQFRRSWLSPILTLVGGIPKTKNVADTQTIRHILGIKRQNGIIGLYPEGRRSWDGRPYPSLYATSKLIKSLKVPVISCVLKGGLLTKPRWAKYSRVGRIDVVYDPILTQERIHQLSVDEIHEIVSQSINHDEYEWQSKEMVEFNGKNLAEHLELFLYVCPKCKAIQSMTSSGNVYKCNHCNYSVTYDKYGYFNEHNHSLIYANPQQWNRFQLDYMKDKIINTATEDTYIFNDQKIIFKSGSNNRKGLHRHGIGTLQLYIDKIKFIPEGGEEIVFSLNNIHGENIQLNHIFEFYYEHVLYSFLFKKVLASAFKYVCTIAAIKELEK